MLPCHLKLRLCLNAASRQPACTLIVWSALSLATIAGVAWILRALNSDARPWAIAACLALSTLFGALWHLSRTRVPLAPGQPAEARTLLADATVLKQQAELAHLSRIASVGEMATSLAHEINQPLAAIVNYLGAATATIDGFPRAADSLHPGALADAPAPLAAPFTVLREAVRCASEQAQRAGQIIHRLRRFARRGDPVDYGPIDLNATLIEAVRLVEPEMHRSHSRVELDLPPHLPAAHGNTVEVQQVLVNLLQNANDAINNLPIDKRVILVRSIVQSPGVLRVSVIDRGIGISPEVLPRLFEAFFTTRTNGLGLGLAISRTIIENHGGRLTGENHPKGGAIFSFTLRTH